MVEGMSGTQRPAIGRPRTFDPDEALDRALQVFWRQGYEGASLSDLTEAMGISRTSMYAAFGNKEDLFRKALERYASGPASYTERALEQPTARAVAQYLLEGAILTTTARGGPAGCLSVQGALATGAPGQGAREALITWRRKGENALRERFARARVEGDLPPDADPATLARDLLAEMRRIGAVAERDGRLFPTTAYRRPAPGWRTRSGGQSARSACNSARPRRIVASSSPVIWRAGDPRRAPGAGIPAPRTSGAALRPAD